jgi:hypothetical protein
MTDPHTYINTSRIAHDHVRQMLLMRLDRTFREAARMVLLVAIDRDDDDGYEWFNEADRGPWRPGR